MDKESIFSKAEEFLQVFKKGEEFTKEILKENERLRFKMAEIQEDLSRSGDSARTKLYEERIRLLEEELTSLKDRFSQVEAENKDFAAKYIDVEEENNNLANLYVASYQLHSTLDFDEVLRIVLEIIINLIGAEKFAIFLMDEKNYELMAAASEGVALEELPHIITGEGLMGRVAKDGDSFFAENIESQSVSFDSPIVCIPLKIKEHIIGLISIYSLLTQKTGFSRMDYELFNLLAGHAATAIFSSKLYTQSERKLTTIQSFLDLLKDKPKK